MVLEMKSHVSTTANTPSNRSVDCKHVENVNANSMNIWPPRKTLSAGSENIIKKILVDPSKILEPHLHLQLGPTNQLEKFF